MTFGRPSMIANWLSNAVPLPLMIDDYFLDTQTEGSATRPDGGATEVAFFVKSLELYRIINDSLLELYMRPGEGETQDKEFLVSVLQLDSRLTQWARSIPNHLCHLPGEAKADFILQRQRIVLRARWVSYISISSHLPDVSLTREITKLPSRSHTRPSSNCGRVFTKTDKTK